MNDNIVQLIYKLDKYLCLSFEGPSSATRLKKFGFPYDFSMLCHHFVDLSYEESSCLLFYFLKPSCIVHEQVLKRKSIAVSNETVSVGPIRRVHQRYNRTSPPLETRPGYRRYLGAHGSKLDEGSEQSARTQKRCCLDKGGDGTLGSLDDRVHVNYGQAPAQSAEMAAKILKQLDTLVPVQKENMSELKKNHLGPSPTEFKDTIAVATEKIVDSTSNNSDNEKPPASLGRHTPNLVLSSEIDRNRMSVPSNGFTFPVPAGLGAHALAPPTPTLASPPVLPAEKQQPSAVFSANTSVETHPRLVSLSHTVCAMQFTVGKLLLTLGHYFFAMTHPCYHVGCSLLFLAALFSNLSITKLIRLVTLMSVFPGFHNQFLNKDQWCINLITN